ncbi:alpha/beta fold hydrolase [Aquicoccus sp. SCR17]|nr:alpha/beta fold hydrolase [Carideicomes alvinocaridis]
MEEPVRRLALALAVAVAWSVPAEAQEDASSCAIPVSPDEVLGDTLLCGRIEVPENWEVAGGRTIPISYVVLRSTSLAPFEDAVIYFQGGPGGSALNSFGLISGGTKLLRENRDVIIMEQRGTAHSNELFCPLEVRVTSPETYEDDNAAADARFEEIGIDAYSDPDAVYDMMAEYAAISDFGPCVPYLEAQGNDLTQYRTTSTVQDVIALMEHLGYPAYNLYGGSYGTTVALAIMDHYETHPDASLPPLRAAVIDAVAPRNREFYEEAFIASYVVLRIFGDCEAEPACAAAYPGIRQRAADLLAAIEAEPLIAGETTVDIDALVEVLRSATGTQQALVPFLPRLVAELENGETAVFDLAQAAARYEITLPPVQREQNASAPVGSLADVTAQVRSISEQFDAIEESLATMMLQDAIIRDAALDATSRREFFLAMLERYVDIGGGSTGNIVQTKLESFLLHPEQRTREGLLAFIADAVLFPTLQAEMTSLAEAFDDDEVSAVFRTLTRAAFERGISPLASTTHRIVRCNDEGRGFFNDTAFEAYADFETPQLIGNSAYWVANYQISCEQLGLAAEEYAPPEPGVVSDVPTLVVNGALDMATPVEWGERAAETLTNATVVTIPMAGHTSGLLTPCGNAVVQAFILSPDFEVTLSCINDARPVFVLPDDALPG